MLVSEIIKGIESKSLTMKQVAEKYDVSDRTVQTKIKNLGYTWISKESKYDYLGELPEPIELEFSSLLTKNKSQNSTGNKKTKKASTSVSKSTSKNNVNSEIASTKENETISDAKAQVIINDALDRLLYGEDQPKRIYRGFYIDEDIISIIDNVKSGNKSDVINEALRMVFKEKGLL